MGKGTKSQAQLRRLQQRAETRGEVYMPPFDKDAPSTKRQVDRDARLHSSDQAPPSQSELPSVLLGKGKALSSPPCAPPILSSSKHHQSKNQKIAQQLQHTLKEILSDSSLKAKDRRSAKRKAEAIATEKSGMTSHDLLTWYDKLPDKSNPGVRVAKDALNNEKRYPYIAFVGQLSYQTTSEGIFTYLQKQLGNDIITDENLKVRLLTQKGAAQQSRGMAFVETSTPELLYKCISLHHTYIDGRRINIEKSAGGRNPVRRQSKLVLFRKNQLSHHKEILLSKHHQFRMSEKDSG